MIALVILHKRIDKNSATINFIVMLGLTNILNVDKLKKVFKYTKKESEVIIDDCKENNDCN